MDPFANRLMLDGRTWRTPLTDVEPTQVGGARLRRSTWPRGGVYRMEGTHGAEYAEVAKRAIPVTELQLRYGDRDERRGHGWMTWMVDDPLHWWATEEAVNDLPSGGIVCAGLGLGLMCHHLMKRPDITAITVVELDPDVIRLITPTLPVDPRRTIVCDEFYAWLARGRDPGVPRPPEGQEDPERRIDGVYWDLAVGDGKDDAIRWAFFRGRALVKVHAPEAKLVMFGERRKPAWQK